MYNDKKQPQSVTFQTNISAGTTFCFEVKSGMSEPLGVFAVSSTNVTVLASQLDNQRLLRQVQHTFFNLFINKKVN